MRRSGVQVLIVVAVLWTQIAHAADWADQLLPYVPHDAEVVVCVDVKGLVSHDLYGRIRQSLDLRELDVFVDTLEGFTGVNLLRDVDAFALVGELRDGGNGAVILKGAWPQEELIGMVSMSAVYEEREYGGEIVHGWEDEDTGAMNYAAFLGPASLRGPGILAISSEPLMLWRIIDAAAKPARAAPAGRSGPADSAPLAIALVAPPADRAVDNPIAGRMKQASLALTAGEDDVTVSLHGEALNAADAPLLSEMLRGAVAFLQLHLGLTQGGPWPVRTSAQGALISGTLTVEMDRAMDLLAACQEGKIQQPRQ
ncbi:MAG: hypothetical protein GY851_31550 [bacterium]|nr:hypothetical protein [bacterium]